MVEAGEPLTFDVAGSSSILPHTADGIRDDAIQELDAWFSDVLVSITTPSFTDDPLRIFKGLQYTAVVVATPRADYGDPHDVASLVRHAFYNAAGQLPTVAVRGVDPDLGPPTKETPGTNITLIVGLAAAALVALAVVSVSR